MFSNSSDARIASLYSAIYLIESKLSIIHSFSELIIPYILILKNYSESRFTIIRPKIINAKAKK